MSHCWQVRLRLAHTMTNERWRTWKSQNVGGKATAKGEKARFADEWERPFSDNTTARDERLRQATESSDQNRTLSGRRVTMSGRSPRKSDGWQRIGWRQGTVADGGLRRRWSDSAADIKAWVFAGRIVHFGVPTLHNVLVIHSNIRCAVLEKSLLLHFYFAFKKCEKKKTFLKTLKNI